MEFFLFETLSGQMLVGAFALVNVIAFAVMALDKRRAVRGRNAERAPEGFMFFLAALFGGVGVYFGMYVLRHKTRTWYFQIGIPLMIVQNMATAYVAWLLVMQWL